MTNWMMMQSNKIRLLLGHDDDGLVGDAAKKAEHHAMKRSRSAVFFAPSLQTKKRARSGTVFSIQSLNEESVHSSSMESSTSFTNSAHEREPSIDGDYGSVNDSTLKAAFFMVPAYKEEEQGSISSTKFCIADARPAINSVDVPHYNHGPRFIISSQQAFGTNCDGGGNNLQEDEEPCQRSLVSGITNDRSMVRNIPQGEVKKSRLPPPIDTIYVSDDDTCTTISLYDERMPRPEEDIEDGDGDNSDFTVLDGILILKILVIFALLKQLYQSEILLPPTAMITSLSNLLGYSSSIDDASMMKGIQSFMSVIALYCGFFLFLGYGHHKI